MNTIKSRPYSASAIRQRGSIAVMAAALMIPIVGLTTYAIDIANINYNQNNLQIAVNAAALYGGQQIGAGSTTTTTDTETWLGNYFNTNPLSGNSSLISGTCCTLGNLGAPYVTAGNTTNNAIKVTKSATVNLFFGALIGTKTNTIKATAIAIASGGVAKPVNVMLILDTTASMTSSNSGTSCSLSTALNCELDGAYKILSQLNAISDNIGVVTFPPTSTAPSTSVNSSGCSSSPAYIAYMYNNIASDTTGSYSTLAAAENNNQTLNSMPPYMSLGILNYAGSPIVNAIKGTSSTTSGCLKALGTSTYLAQALYVAQDNLCKLSGYVVGGVTGGVANKCNTFATQLDTHNGTGTTSYSTYSGASATAANGLKNIIILLSDGDSNSGALNYPTGTKTRPSPISVSVIPGTYSDTALLAPAYYDRNECQQAVIAANVAKTASTTIYSISYASPNNTNTASSSTGMPCPTDASGYTNYSATGNYKSLATYFGGYLYYSGSNSTSGNIIVPGSVGLNLKPCQAMAMIAGTTSTTTVPDTTKTSAATANAANLSYFYHDGCSGSAATSFGNNNKNVINLLSSVGQSMTGARLVSNTAF